MNYYVYILQCADYSLYTGYTTDVKKREATHNKGKGAKYTKSRLPVKVIYWEQYTTKEAAMKREYKIKQMSREQKIKLMLRPKI